MGGVQAWQQTIRTATDVVAVSLPRGGPSYGRRSLTLSGDQSVSVPWGGHSFVALTHKSVTALCVGAWKETPAMTAVSLCRPFGAGW